MERVELYELLKKVEAGTVSAREALEDVSLQPDMLVGNYADIDLHRHMRQGMPEVIYGEGKTAEQIVGIASAMAEKDIRNILITRLSREKADAVAEGLGVRILVGTAEQAGKADMSAAEQAGKAEMSAAEQAGKAEMSAAEQAGKAEMSAAERAGKADMSAAEQAGKAEMSAVERADKTETSAAGQAGDSGRFPMGRKVSMTYDPVSRIGIVNGCEVEKKGKIAVIAAGTSDLPVAEEAAITAELYGNYVERVYDVGVAGIHRLLNKLTLFEDANVVVAVAGMEGALVSVIGGLVACPVIGVPTSVGYGANFGGLAALLSMLNSCASGVSVVNIDNGFGAGVLASKINRQAIRE